MNQKGFSLFAVIIGLVILLLCLQFAFNQYSKSLSKGSDWKPKSAKSKTKKGTPQVPFQESVSLKVSVLPQLDNILKEQQIFFATQGSYAEDISSLSVSIPLTFQYQYGVSNNKDGWVAWAKKSMGDKKFLISKNIYTKQLCCKDIDKGSCQSLAITTITCPL